MARVVLLPPRVIPVYTQHPKIQSVQQNALNIRYVLSRGNRLFKEFFTGSYYKSIILQSLLLPPELTTFQWREKCAMWVWLEFIKPFGILQEEKCSAND